MRPQGGGKKAQPLCEVWLAVRRSGIALHPLQKNLFAMSANWLRKSTPVIYFVIRSVPREGRVAIVTNAGRNAVAASASGAQIIVCEWVRLMGGSDPGEQRSA
jgi:hypothetical protein